MAPSVMLLSLEFQMGGTNMRGIKFKFWSKRFNKMIMPVKWADILIKGDGKIYCWIDIAENSGLSKLYKKDYIPLQFTGFKDKYNQEIYEGDIIRFKWDSGDGLTYHRTVVEWTENTGFAPFSTNGFDPSECEVIGDIYRDPQLLGGEE